MNFKNSDNKNLLEKDEQEKQKLDFNPKFNLLWLTLLEKTELSEENFNLKYKKKKLQIHYEKHDLLKTKVSNLDFDESNTFFTEQYVNNLNLILNNKDPKIMSLNEKKKIQTYINQLNEDEYEWKARLKKSQHESHILDELFHESVLKFEELLTNYIHPKKNEILTQRGHVNYFKKKFIVFVKGIAEILIEKNHLKSLSFIRDLTKDDFNDIINNYIKPKRIYQDLLRVILKKAHDNLFSSKTKNSHKYSSILSDKSLVVAKPSVFYEFRRVLALYFVLIVLTFYSEKYPEKKIQVEKLALLIRDFLWQNSHNYDSTLNKWWVKEHSDNTNAILLLLESSKLFTDIINEKREEMHHILQEKKYVLPISFQNVVVKYTKLPNILKPMKVTDFALDQNLKKGLFGETGITKSNSFKKLLNIAQNKSFSINKYYLSLLYKLCFFKTSELFVISQESKLSNVKFPFLLRHEFDEIDTEFEEYSKDFSLDCTHQHFLNEINAKLVGEFDGIQLDKNQLKTLIGASKLEISVYEYLKNERLNIHKEKIQRKYAASCIAIAKCYQDHALYITNVYCVRLRLYPKEPLIARTSGVFKQLLCDFSEKKVSIRGFEELLKCYYNAHNLKLMLFETFLKNNKRITKDKLSIFFKKNPLDFSNLKDNILYSSVLHMEILRVIRKGSTKVNVEIDQTASAICFLALLLRNRKMAVVSNLLSNEPLCPYTYCKTEFQKFYDLKFENKNAFILNFLVSDRKVHKYALMCWCYSQKYKGRIDDFKERFYELYAQDLLQEEFLCLNEFAQRYDEFIEFIFPNVTKQINILLEVINLVATETGKVRIATLEGEKIWWSCYKHESIVRNGFNPITKAFASYRIETTIIDESTKSFITDLRDHKVKALSYIIHSIDAAIIQRFIRLMFEKHNYIINSLHDCVLLHPNYVGKFYDVVYEVFTSKDLYNVSFNCIFDIVKSDLSSDSLIKLEKLKEQYLFYCDDFETELKNLNPRHIYKPES